VEVEEEEEVHLRCVTGLGFSGLVAFLVVALLELALASRSLLHLQRAIKLGLSLSPSEKGRT
jgi:hypothetical protein